MRPHLDKARQSLRSAEMLLAAGDFDGAVDRAYSSLGIVMTLGDHANNSRAQRSQNPSPRLRWGGYGWGGVRPGETVEIVLNAPPSLTLPHRKRGEGDTVPARSTFERLTIETGLLPIEIDRLIGREEQSRLFADYGDGIHERAEADLAVQQASAFVSACAKLVSGQGGPP